MRTKVSNNGSAYVPISWYPHPFFPPVKDGVMFSLPPLSVMEKPTGFFSNDGNLYYRNKGVGDDLSFQPLRTHSPFLDAFIFTFAGYSCHMQVTIIQISLLSGLTTAHARLSRIMIRRSSLQGPWNGASVMSSSSQNEKRPVSPAPLHLIKSINQMT